MDAILTNPNAFQSFQVVPAPSASSQTVTQYRLFLGDVVEMVDSTKYPNVHSKRATVKSVFCRVVEVYEQERNTQVVEAVDTKTTVASLSARNAVGMGEYAVARDRGSGVLLDSLEDVEAFRAAAGRVRLHVEAE